MHSYSRFTYIYIYTYCIYIIVKLICVHILYCIEGNWSGVAFLSDLVPRAIQIHWPAKERQQIVKISLTWLLGMF